MKKLENHISISELQEEAGGQDDSAKVLNFEQSAFGRHPLQSFLPIFKKKYENNS